MTVRRDLTTSDMARLRTYSARGMAKTHAAKELGVSHRWIDVSAKRLGLDPEIDRLFPRDYQKLRAFSLGDGQTRRLKALVEAQVPMRDIAQKLGCCEMTLRKAIKDAGIGKEISALMRRTQKTQEPEAMDAKKLPRDVDPVVNWLTRPRRTAT